MFEMFRNFDRRQWMIFIVFSISNFCQAICVSLQAPFYPHEAEKKGATATGQHSSQSSRQFRMESSCLQAFYVIASTALFIYSLA